MLILSIPQRLSKLNKLVETLCNQLEKEDLEAQVELLVFLDNKIWTIADKRNQMLEMANGDYLTFLDDDDRLSADYFKTVIDLINEDSDPDVITFDQECTINGRELL